MEDETRALLLDVVHALVHADSGVCPDATIYTTTKSILHIDNILMGLIVVMLIQQCELDLRRQTMSVKMNRGWS
jgi:hypothetical protein